jgi:predicted GNAT superfamily acetyltransferase
VGILIGWGGFVERPRVVSDLMAVVPQARNLGLAEGMKRLQAAIALTRGFEEIVWTVDPLRAANARLNFGKLGAISRKYELDRYGTGFAADLYGGMPTDRLHITWEITSPRVLAMLTGGSSHLLSDQLLPHYQPGSPATHVAIAIPDNIDAMLSASPEEARFWRMRLRTALTTAFSEGFTIVGFRPASGQELPALVLERSEGNAN